MCGSSNAVKRFVQHLDQEHERALERDLLRAGQSATFLTPGQTFRQPTHGVHHHNGGQQFSAFQGGSASLANPLDRTVGREPTMASGLSNSNPHPFDTYSRSDLDEYIKAQPGDRKWADDFRQMHSGLLGLKIAQGRGQAAEMGPVSNSIHGQPLTRPTIPPLRPMHNTPPPHEVHSMGDTFFMRDPFVMNNPFAMDDPFVMDDPFPLHTSPMTHAPPMTPMRTEPTSGAFPSMVRASRDTIEQDRIAREFDAELEAWMDKYDIPVSTPADAPQLTAENLAAFSNNNLRSEQPPVSTPNQSTTTKDTPDRSQAGDSELAKAAQLIINSVAENQTDKFKNSDFFKMMRRIAEQDLVVRDNALVQVDQTSTTADSGIGSGFDSVRGGSKSTPRRFTVEDAIAE